MELMVFCLIRWLLEQLWHSVLSQWYWTVWGWKEVKYKIDTIIIKSKTMKMLKFKTNINCTGCLSKVTPYLNKIEGIKEWDVDLNDDDRMLTISSIEANIGTIIKQIHLAGYSAEEIEV